MRHLFRLFDPAVCTARALRTARASRRSRGRAGWRLLAAAGLGALLAGCAGGGGGAAGTGGSSAPAGTAAQQPAAAVQTAVREHTIEGLDPGIRLYLKEKLPAGGSALKEAVLFLEPFGVPTADAFDVPGYSWMEHLAGNGYDTWALDFRGFGRSTRPATMEAPPNQNPPVVRLDDVLKDVSAAVDYIKKTRSVATVDLIGWSYGAVAAAAYAEKHPDSVGRLVLYGGMHGFKLPSMTAPMEEQPGVFKKNIPAYQLAEFSMTMNHWNMMMNGRPLAAPEAIEAVKAVFLKSDPTAADRNPPAVRRPMGPMVDLYYIWSDRPIFNAANIRVPVLVVRGDADFFADPGLYAKLTGAAKKREVVIPEATHWALYEKNRGGLLSETLKFLEEM